MLCQEFCEGTLDTREQGSSQPRSSQGHRWDTYPPWQDTVSSNASPSLDGTACRISAFSIPSAKLQDFKYGILLPELLKGP